jgi:nitrogen fixation NifU-like protein
MSLQDLYQEIILDHGKVPRYTGSLSNATHRMAGHNPVCGDQLMLYIIEREGVVVEARFEGSGCAISVASASLMIESIVGKSVDDITKLFKQFHALVVEGVAQDDIGKLAAFGGVNQFPMRVKCATLAWHTLQAALQQTQTTVTTE